jgi:hypothetical protein
VCRVEAASEIFTNAKGKKAFFMSGGIHGNELLNITQTFDGKNWYSEQTENLPEPVWEHCIVKINSTTLLSIGGKEYEYKLAAYPSNNTYFYNVQVNKWTPGPSLNIPRSALSCGILQWKNDETNQLEKVVVAAGGWNSSGNGSPFVELLHLNHDGSIKGEWVVGPELPNAAPDSTMIEYNNSVILIGGGFSRVKIDYKPNEFANKIYFEYGNSKIRYTTYRRDAEGCLDGVHLYQLFSPNGVWVQMKQTLETKRRGHVAFLVPDELVNCHE